MGSPIVAVAFVLLAQPISAGLPAAGPPTAVNPGATTRADFALTGEGAIAGVVTDEATGDPVAYLGVVVFDESGSSVASGFTDENGRYTVGGLAAGTHFVQADSRPGDRVSGFLGELFDDVPCPVEQSYCDARTGTPVSVELGTTTPGIDFALTKGGTISGRVTDDEAGEPIAGARVLLFDSRSDLIATVSAGDEGLYSISGLPARTYFARAADVAGFLGELYNDVACPGNCNPEAGTPIAVELGAIVEGIDFTLPRGGRISGKVVDHGGDPVPQREVRVSIDRGYAVVPVGTAVTDSEGAYELAGLEAGAYLLRTDGQDDFIDELYDDIACPYACDVIGGHRVDVRLGERTAAVDFVLDRGGSLSGTVRDSGGEPIEGLVVEVYDRDRILTGKSLSDNQGHYRVTGLPAGTYFILAPGRDSLGRPGYLGELLGGSTCNAASECDVTDADPVAVELVRETPGADFTLAKFGSFSGTVVDDDTGEPIAGASISIADPAGNRISGFRRTGENGRYTWDGLRPATYRVYARRGTAFALSELYDGVPCYNECLSTLGTPVVVGLESRVEGIDFSLPQEGSVSGRLVDSANGEALAGLSVTLYDVAGKRISSGVTGEDGRYAVGSLITGTYFALAAGGGFRGELFDGVPCAFECDVTAGSPIDVRLGAEATGVDVALEKGASLAGRVSDEATDGPLPTAQVDVYDARRLVATTLTDADGQYLIDGLNRGTYRILARTFGFMAEVYGGISCMTGACDVSAGDPLRVRLGARLRDLDFALGRAGGFSGTVTNEATGQGIADARVLVHDRGGAHVASASADAQGNFEIWGLSSGTYLAVTNTLDFVNQVFDGVACSARSCELSDGTPILVREDTQTPGVDFALNPGGRISGRVVDESTGEALRSVGIRTTDPTGSFLRVDTSKTDGSYLIVGLPPGGYRVSARQLIGVGSGFVEEVFDDVPCPFGRCEPNAVTTVTVTSEAETSGIDFAVRKSRGVSGRVVDAATGYGLGTVRVEVYDAKGVVLTSGLTRSSGFYRVFGLPEGTYFLRAGSLGPFVGQLYGGVPCTGEVCDVRRGEPVTLDSGGERSGVDFALSRGAAVSGTVIDAETRELIRGGVDVEVFDLSGSRVTATVSDGNGNYRAEGLVAGTYFVRTRRSQGYLGELWNGAACPFECEVTTGTPVAVEAGMRATGIDFALSQGAGISGTIFDEVTGRAVFFFSQVVVLDHAGTPVASVGLGPGQRPNQAFTPRGGRYSVTGLPPGAYFVRASVPGFVDQLFGGVECPMGECGTAGAARVVVRPGGARRGIDFVLRRAGSLSGIVTNELDATPVEDFQVRLFDEDGKRLGIVMTDELGRYEAAGLAPGIYTVRTPAARGFRGELYDDVACPTRRCNVRDGTPVEVRAGVARRGIDFVLTKQE